MKKLILVVACLSTSSAFALVENKKFNANGLKTLNLKNTSGEVNVTVSEDGKAYVAANKIKFDKNCTLKMEKSGNELNIEVDKESLFNNEDCKVNLDVKVPREIALNLRNGSGDLKVNGTQGAIDFELGSGHTKINAEVESLDGKAGSGSIEVAGLHGSADVKTGSGNVTLSYRSAPPKGTLDIKIGSGDATVYFPSSMKVLTDFKSGSGRVYNDLGDSADASFKLSMKTGNGDLKIKKSQ